MDAKGRLGLAEAADRLGVHYMTAYRYLRLGRLPAVQENGRWMVATADVARLARQPAASGRRHRPDWGRRRELLFDTMIAGDGPASWTVVETCLARGGSPGDVHLQLLAPVLREIGERWAGGEVNVAEEHRATAIALRLVGRLGPRFIRQGRPRKGTVLLGGAPGDAHLIPVAMVADIVRGAGFQVVELGADVPPQSFFDAAATLRPATIGVSISVERCVPAAADVIAELKHRDANVRVLAGGPAIDSRDAANAIGAHDWAADALQVAQLLIDQRGGLT